MSMNGKTAVEPVRWFYHLVELCNTLRVPLANVIEGAPGETNYFTCGNYGHAIVCMSDDHKSHIDTGSFSRSA